MSGNVEKENCALSHAIMWWSRQYSPWGEEKEENNVPCFIAALFSSPQEQNKTSSARVQLILKGWFPCNRYESGFHMIAAIAVDRYGHVEIVYSLSLSDSLSQWSSSIAIRSLKSCFHIIATIAELYFCSDRCDRSDRTRSRLTSGGFLRSVLSRLALCTSAAFSWPLCF